MIQHLRTLFALLLFSSLFACAKSNNVEDQVGDKGQNTCKIGTSIALDIYLGNIPAEYSPSDFTVAVTDSRGKTRTLKPKPSPAGSNDLASFNGTGTVGLKHMAQFYLKGQAVLHSFEVGFAGAFCSFNTNFDAKTGMTSTAI